MPSIRIARFRKRADGSIRVRVGKTEREYGSVEHLKVCVRGSFTEDDLIDLALLLALARQPKLANPAAFEGVTVTIDPQSANWGTITNG